MGGLVFKNITSTLKRKYEIGGIITAGVLHRERNNIGDKGIPLVPIETTRYDNQLKIAEIEVGEIIIRDNYAKEINRLVDEYNDCKCPMVLLQLGKLTKFVIDNLSDNQCDINGVCLLKR
jgi:hypothetical protein